jgi:hypothetical protein
MLLNIHRVSTWPPQEHTLQIHHSTMNKEDFSHHSTNIRPRPGNSNLPNLTSVFRMNHLSLSGTRSRKHSNLKASLYLNSKSHQI